MPATKAQALVAGLSSMTPIPRPTPKRSSGWRSGRCSATRRSSRPIRPDGLVIDATGASHLHGGEDAMLAGHGRAAGARRLRRARGDRRHLGRGACACPVRSAAGDRRSAGRKRRRRSRRLPIAALRLPHDMVDALRKLGFERIGELLATPRAPLALRFGPELGRRLDQAIGRLSEPIDPVRPPDLVEVRRSFRRTDRRGRDHRALYRQAGRRSSARRWRRRASAPGASICCSTASTTALQAIRVGTAQPVRDVKRLTRLLCDKIETVDPGFGIEIMSLDRHARRAVGAEADRSRRWSRSRRPMSPA